MSVETETTETEPVENSLIDPQGEPPVEEETSEEETSEEETSEEETSEEETSEEEEEEEEAKGAPEEYADFEAPEGVELDADAMSTFKETAKELNIGQEDAQKLVSIAADLVQKQAESFQRQINEATQGWKDAVEGDPEIGAGPNKGLKSEAQQAVAAARDAFASPELLKMMSETKFGDHPEIVRLFVRIGKAIGEDKLVQAGKPTTPKPFYDHPTSAAASGR